MLGGARSGKSRHAEALVTAHPPPWRYVATAQGWDAEMRARIDAHRARRARGWQTVEVPQALPQALRTDHPVLVDCLTLWLSNLILADQDIEAHAAALEGSLRERTAPTVLVANEVGLGIVPEHALGRRFRDEAGLLNQRMAALASRVLFIAAGLPMRLK